MSKELILPEDWVDISGDWVNKGFWDEEKKYAIFFSLTNDGKVLLKISDYPTNPVEGGDYKLNTLFDLIIPESAAAWLPQYMLLMQEYLEIVPTRL